MPSGTRRRRCIAATTRSAMETTRKDFELKVLGDGGLVLQGRRRPRRRRIALTPPPLQGDGDCAVSRCLKVVGYTLMILVSVIIVCVGIYNIFKRPAVPSILQDVKGPAVVVPDDYERAENARATLLKALLQGGPRSAALNRAATLEALLQGAPRTAAPPRAARQPAAIALLNAKQYDEPAVPSTRAPVAAAADTPTADAATAV